MKDKYVFGIIGAGMIAEKHISSLQKTGRANIKWVSRKDTEKLNEFQHKFNIPHGASDYHQIIEDPEVDAIIITTPPHLHYEMYMAAIHAGKNILLEKPSAINIDEVRKMEEAAIDHPELVISDCSGRHSRLIRKFEVVKEMIVSGKLGEVYYIHHNAISRQSRPGIEYHPTAKWFLDKSIAGGGPLLDWGIYDLSFHLGILGDMPELQTIDSVFLKNGLDNVDPGSDIFDVEEHFSVNMSFSNGLKYYWERSSHANIEAPNQSRIYGTHGGIKVAFCSWDDPEITFYYLDEHNKAKQELIHVEAGPIDDDLALANHYLKCLDHEKQPVMPMSRSRKHLEIIFSLYEKAKSS